MDMPAVEPLIEPGNQARINHHFYPLGMPWLELSAIPAYQATRESVFPGWVLDIELRRIDTLNPPTVGDVHAQHQLAATCFGIEVTVFELGIGQSIAERK